MGSDMPMVMGLDEAGPPADPAADPVAAELQAATVVTARAAPAARAVSL
jgi:hypothetical protein